MGSNYDIFCDKFSANCFVSDFEDSVNNQTMVDVSNNAFNNDGNVTENVWSSERITLFAKEYTYYMDLFKLNNKFNNNFIDNKTASAFLQNSGLSASVLHKIWEIGDKDNKGYLFLEDFFICCRLVAHAQNGKVPSRELVDIQPSCLPSFEIIRHKSFSDISNMEKVVDWEIKPNEHEEYEKIFKSLDVHNEGLIKGDVIKDYYLSSSKLPPCELFQIWSVADMDDDGNLNYEEFCIMNKIVNVRAEHDMQNPLVVPKELLNSIRNYGKNQERRADTKTPQKETPFSFGDWVKTESEKLLRKNDNGEEADKQRQTLTEREKEKEKGMVKEEDEEDGEEKEKEKLDMNFDFFDFKSEKASKEIIKEKWKGKERGKEKEKEKEKGKGKEKGKKKNIDIGKKKRKKNATKKDQHEDIRDEDTDEEDEDKEEEEETEEQEEEETEAQEDEEEQEESLFFKSAFQAFDDSEDEDTDYEDIAAGNKNNLLMLKNKYKKESKGKTKAESGKEIKKLEKKEKQEKREKTEKLEKQQREMKKGIENNRGKEKKDERAIEKEKRKKLAELKKNTERQFEKLRQKERQKERQTERQQGNVKKDKEDEKFQKIIEFNYCDLKDYNIDNKDIHKIEEINRKLEEEIIKKKEDIEKRKKKKDCLSYIYQCELKKFQCLKEERRNLEFIDLCLYKDIRHKRDCVMNMKKEVKELIQEINKINAENVNLNKSYIRKEKEIKDSDEKRTNLNHAINKERDFLKKDERSLLILTNMVEYLKKQKNRALKLKESLKNRFDITNADHQMLVKNIMHQQNHLNEIVNKRLNIEKLKNEKLVLFNSLANQSFMIDLQNAYPFLNKELTNRGVDFNFDIMNTMYVNGNNNTNYENNLSVAPSINNLRTFNKNLQKRYYTDHKGIPNRMNEEISSSKKNESIFENIKNGDNIDIFSSVEDFDSNVEIEEKNVFEDISDFMTKESSFRTSELHSRA